MLKEEGTDTQPAVPPKTVFTFFSFSSCLNPYNLFLCECVGVYVCGFQYTYVGVCVCVYKHLCVGVCVFTYIHV